MISMPTCSFPMWIVLLSGELTIQLELIELNKIKEFHAKMKTAARESEKTSSKWASVEVKGIRRSLCNCE